MADIGSTLREARMRDRIDISEVEAQTKIRAKYLRAIENEEWDLLPGPVYAKSFLRTYGDFLGLDSRMLIEEFKRRYEHPSDYEVRPMSSLARERERDRSFRRPRLPTWAPVGIAVVVIVVILYVVGSFTPSNSPAPAANHPIHQRTTPRVLPQTTTTTPAAPTNATLQLVPTSAVYVCLVNGRGVKLINEQTFTAGQTIPSETGARLLLTLGNASVQMKVNGNAVPVAASSTAIRLLITSSGVRHILLSRKPTCP